MHINYIKTLPYNLKYIQNVLPYSNKYYKSLNELFSQFTE